MADAIRLLFIDDDPGLLDMVELSLEAKGFEVYTTDNGRDGIEMAGELLPDVILLDVMMPGMNGLEVLKKLKGDDVTSELPVFMLSAKTTMGDIEEAFEEFADDYITKPIELPELAKVIRKKLELWGARQQNKLKVYLIDDDQTFVRMTQKVLKLSGFDVRSFNYAGLGIRMAKKERPDLILLDIDMPGFDGVSALDIIKNDPKTKDIPVFMLTGMSSIGMAERSFNYGADDFIAKPVNYRRLGESLKSRLDNLEAVKNS